ncbi:hypothetical protein BURMUCGD1_4314 [Burkholderia multivorans CGD1]|nr:hypothetical protein BURMUCGD1_4314 [Burkholderia multivorans CGD1]
MAARAVRACVTCRRRQRRRSKRCGRHRRLRRRVSVRQGEGRTAREPAARQRRTRNP